MIALLVSLLRRHYFLTGIVFVILFAHLFPHIGAKGGLLKPEITVKYVAVFIIFFNSGISIKTEDLTKAVLQIRIHLFIQCFTFIVFPCIMPAAIFNSALGSFLGIFATPALILNVIGNLVDVPMYNIATQLSLTVLFPLVLGQILRKHAKLWLDRKHIPFSCIGSCILLLIIYTTFCDTFSNANIGIDFISLMSVIFLIVIIQCILLFSIFMTITQVFKLFIPPDAVAVLFCCTHKSLTLGIPIVKILFSNHPGLSVISVPLLIYHPTQILLGGLLVPTIRGWLLYNQKYRTQLYKGLKMGYHIHCNPQDRQSTVHYSY
ncbi:P7 [Mytilus edulis]|uniref:SLC10A7 n=1 Tax=Mytilus edulis TaxID=6550 RepID=A0A8S3U282_MYTED|nr:P7 [Mytilus edulis]